MRDEPSVHMKIATARAWLQVAVLAPVVFVLAVGAVILAAMTGPHGRVPGPERVMPPGPVPTGPFVQPDETTGLVIRAAVPAANGRALITVTVRITTVPPVPRATLETAGGSLARIIGPLVESLPPDWTPNAAGLAALKRAIEEAAPVTLAPALPVGTHVTVFADVTAGPVRPSP